jgi:hypothetical protein
VTGSDDTDAVNASPQDDSRVDYRNVVYIRYASESEHCPVTQQSLSQTFRESVEVLPNRLLMSILVGRASEVGLEVNPEKTKCMLMSRFQKEGQKHSIKIGNRSFEDVAKFRYLGTTPTDQKCMHEKIKSRLNSGERLLPFSSESSVLPPADWER